MTETLEMGAQIAEWRRKALARELSTDELRQWVEHCRAGRVSAAATSAKSRAKKEPPNVDDMLDELDAL